MRKLLLFIFIALLTLNASAQLDKGLLANWPLDGNGLDSSGNRYHCNFIGTAALASDRFGNAGCAVSLGQKNSYLEYYKSFTSNTFLFWRSDRTLSFWFKPDNIQRTSGAHLVRHTYNYSNPYFDNYYIDLEKNDTLNFCKKIATNVSLAKEWHHLVISYDYDSNTYSNKTMIYWNNKLIQTEWQLDCSGGESYDAFLRFGEGVGTKLDDMRFYNRALSASEVTELYNLPSSCSNVLGLENEEQSIPKILLRIVTPLGQEVKLDNAVDGLFIYQYSDGSIKKVMKKD